MKCGLRGDGLRREGELDCLCVIWAVKIKMEEGTASNFDQCSFLLKILKSLSRRLEHSLLSCGR